MTVWRNVARADLLAACDRYSVDEIERLYRLKLEQCYKEGTGRLMALVGKMYGPNARRLSRDKFMRATYAWLALKPTEPQLDGLLQRADAATADGGVNVYACRPCVRWCSLVQRRPHVRFVCSCVAFCGCGCVFVTAFVFVCVPSVFIT